MKISFNVNLEKQINVQFNLPNGVFLGTESEIPPGGWRVSNLNPSYPTQDVYRSECGRCHFKFGFYPTGNIYEIDILQMPNYPSNLKSNLHRTHRLPSNHGNDYRICFGNDSNVNNIDNARKWAAIWSEHTVALIEDDIDFPNN